MKTDKYDEVFESMLKVIFMDFNDLLVAYIPSEKWAKISIIGKEKVKRQKNRAKKGLPELKKAQRSTFLLGCYEELYMHLMRVVKPHLIDPIDYNEFSDALRTVIDDEKIKMEEWIQK